jgi:DNA-binding transcriptional LysR family regulator
MELELRHLRVVCAVAETGSMTKAAARLGLAQPALTGQVKRIERALGGRLFERDRHGARPTALGELVLARARVLLPAARDLQDEATRFASAPPGTARCRLGAANGPILGRLVDRILAANPELDTTTLTDWSASRLAELVRVGRLDFALVGVCGDAPPPAGTDLVWEVLATDAVFLLVPREHPAAGRDEVELARFADTRWVATPGDGCFADCFTAACAGAGFTPSMIYEVDVGSCADLVAAGRAVGLCQPTFRLVPGVVTVPIAGTPLRWRQLLGWHRHGPAAALAGLVAGYARAAYAEAVAGSPGYRRWLSAHPGFGPLPA